MKTINKNKVARESVFKKSEEAEGVPIKGYNFDEGVNYEKIIDSYETTGAQASNLAQAIKIIKKMRKEKAFVYLGYTSNMVTSGLRDVFRYLVKHKLVDVVVTTAGGIEDDIIKCLGDFKLGSFRLKGAELREKGINRTGNMLIPNSRYCKFEDFILPILEKHKNEILTPSKLIRLLGKEINNEESIYYWTQKNNIPVFCPAITDGSIGDMIYFFKNKNPNFKIDVSDDMVEINNSTIGKEKTGVIILGAGVIKHHILNANLFRNGADYAVYINNAQENDASDAGALPEEAISWGKLTKECESVKVYGDATILFPLIVAKCFAKK
ncbi:MAG: deoxyhypusine synthase [Nanoarchaeota archaeon]|nr:deoxyhypusine synthase [Nanoarchaeota archaeon]